MKIEVVPWAKVTSVKMEDLYTELSIGKLENTPTGPQSVQLGSYKELFEENRNNEQQNQRKDKNATKIPVLANKGKKCKRRNVSRESQKNDDKDKKTLIKGETVKETSKAKRVLAVKDEGRKVLMKGNPGMGKTTLAKKIAWDWAKRSFTVFTIVFFVSMKLVKPGDAIENIIIRQCPTLEGLDVTEQKLQCILDIFGNRCLIIIDGFDEHIFDTKDDSDIIKMLKGQKYLHCNIVLTSRPHITADIQDNFQAIIEVQGFKKDHASRFISKLLRNKHNKNHVLTFNTENFTSENSMHACPMLLLFICFLVNNGEIDFARRNVHLGEIYARIICCIYRKYITQKKESFEKNKYVDALKRVGKLALKALQCGLAFFLKSDLIKDVGEDVFEYGLFIGQEDFNLSADETADIVVTFLHSSIQEFLGAFYFIQMLDDGETVDRLFEGDGKEPIFMMNPLFFSFCLWLLSNTQSYFTFQSKDRTREILQCYISKRIDLTELDFASVAGFYPALDIRYACKRNDTFVKSFYTETISNLKNTRHLLLSSDDPFGWILDSLHPVLHQLLSIQIFGYLYKKFSFYFDTMLIPSPCLDDLNIAISTKEYSCLNELLTHLTGLNRCISFYIIVTGMESYLELSKIAKEGIGKLHIVCNHLNSCRITVKHEIESCQFLTHLSLSGLPKEESTIVALSKAVTTGKLPKLSHLSLAGSMFTLKGKLSLLFQSTWPTLTYLNLYSCFLDKSDIQVLFGREKNLLPQLTSLVLFLGEIFDLITIEDLSKSRKLQETYLQLERDIDVPLLSTFENSWPNLTSLWLHDVNKSEYKGIIANLNRGRLPSLTDLGISMWKFADKQKHKQIPLAKTTRRGHPVVIMKEENDVEWLEPVNIPSLTHLTLNRFICSKLHLDMVTQSTVLTELHKLDISHSSGVTGTLSKLLCHSFPFLNSLILSDCGLNSQDLKELARAYTKGRLPQLRYLDMCRNEQLKGNFECFFPFNQKWEKLQGLNFEQVSPVCDKDFKCLVRKVQSGDLSSLQKLTFSVSNVESLHEQNVLWQHLSELNACSTLSSFVNVLVAIANAVEEGLFPALRTVSVTLLFPPIDAQTDTKLKTERESLGKKLHERLPDSLVVQVLISLENTLFNLQNTLQIERIKAATRRNYTGLILVDDEMVENVSTTAAESMTMSLTDPLTPPQCAFLRTTLRNFMVAIAKIIIPDTGETFSIVEEIVNSLASAKRKLRKHNISVSLYNISRFEYRYCW